MVTVSGYSDRLSVKNIEYIPTNVVRDYLVNNEGFDKADANKVVDKIGSHLGHINKVRQHIFSRKKLTGRWTSSDIDGKFALITLQLLCYLFIYSFILLMTG